MFSIFKGSTPPIDTRSHPRALAALEEVTINGSRQWLLIRTHDVSNPIVLFVHGGPGTSQLALARSCTQPLERHFTVVNWDQCGAGKSFAASRDRRRMNMPQFVDDVIEVASQLTRRFHQTKLVLVGHSWGSALGMLAAAKRPDLFSAYVGIGQVSDAAEGERRSYAWTLEQARAAKDSGAVRSLTAQGPPPYTGAAWRSKFLTQRRLLARYGGEYYGSRSGAFGVVLRHVALAPEYSLTDRVSFFRGIFRSLDLLFPELYRTNLFVQVPALEIPVFFCLGRHDYEVPSGLSAQYFEALRAPNKQLLWFENSAHMPNTEEADKFNQFMIDTLRPMLPTAAKSPTSGQSAA